MNCQRRIDNLEALLRAVRARPARRQFVDLFAESRACRDRVSLLTLIPYLPHFKQLGVRADGGTGWPVMAGGGGDMLGMSATLGHLFGAFGACSAYDVLAAPYGDGAWDATLRRWFPAPPSDKQLTLARLFAAVEVARGTVAGNGPPEKAPDAAVAILGLPDGPVEDGYCLRNVDVLLAAVEAQPAPDMFLYTWLHGWTTTCNGRRWIHPAALMPMLRHFKAQGVVADAAGRPCVQRTNGELLMPEQTFLRLFGTFERHEAFEALFQEPCEGSWDTILQKNAPEVLGDKALVLARLRHAQALLRGTVLATEFA